MSSGNYHRCAVFLCCPLGIEPARAAVVEVDVTIKSVDAKARGITVIYEAKSEQITIDLWGFGGLPRNPLFMSANSDIFLFRGVLLDQSNPNGLNCGFFLKTYSLSPHEAATSVRESSSSR